MDVWTERRDGWKSKTDDARNEYDIDYSRVIHSASFRRLQGKTQILNLGDSDFYRTRLTHSLEVAQIAGGIRRQLEKDSPGHPYVKTLPDLSLIQAIGLTHDLGHPPFGHGGEVALNYCMRNYGGFEGNGQTLRILSKLEHYSEKDGANLTRRSLLGILKYPASYNTTRKKSISPNLHFAPTSIRMINRESSKPPKCFLDSELDVVGWILENISDSDREEFQKIELKDNKHSKPIHKSFDCSIMDIADDIAYGVHDLEDAISLKLISADQFREYINEKACSCFLDTLKKSYPSESANNVYDRFVNGLFSSTNERKRYISRMVYHFIVNTEVKNLEIFDEDLLDLRVVINQPQRLFLNSLNHLISEEVIKSPKVQHLEFKGQKMVVSVFEALESEPKSLLPKEFLSKYKESGEDKRIICDYVAGMTDFYLLKTYDRLFSPRMGSVFDDV